MCAAAHYSAVRSWNHCQPPVHLALATVHISKTYNHSQAYKPQSLKDANSALATGEEIPGYRNIWHWILDKLTTAERGAKRGPPKVEAILKWAHHPIAMLGGLWEEQHKKQSEEGMDPRPPVFILVCKTTQLAKVIYQWIAEDKAPASLPPVNVEGFRNRDGRINTIRVDSKVVHETDTGEAKDDESRWMRLTLDTVGKMAWPVDRQGRQIYRGSRAGIWRPVRSNTL